MTPKKSLPSNMRHAVVVAGIHGQLICPNLEPKSLIVCIHGGGCNERYFDLPKFSFTDVALSAGHAVLLVDWSSDEVSMLQLSNYKVAQLLPLLITKALGFMSGGDVPVALFGHSIGGAIAMHCAAQQPDLARSLITSGIGTRPSDAVLSWHRSLCADNVFLPHQFFFGPEGSFDWRAPIAIRECAEPWRRSNIDEILFKWPNEFPTISSHIFSPVLSILSEHERIWENDIAALEEMRRSFAAGRATVEIAAGGGHLYEVHRNWYEHAARILMFIEENIE